MRFLNAYRFNIIQTLCALSFLTSSSLIVAQENVPEVSIYDVQFTESTSGASPYAGQEVAISGVV